MLFLNTGEKGDIHSYIVLLSHILHLCYLISKSKHFFIFFSGVMECVMFETEDLVCRKNEKHVILTLLEVARRGARLGMLAPMLVQFEQEIDREIAR